MSMHNPYFGARLDIEWFTTDISQSLDLSASHWMDYVSLASTADQVYQTISKFLPTSADLTRVTSAWLPTICHRQSCRSAIVDGFNSLFFSILLVAGSNHLARSEPKGIFPGPALELNRSHMPLRVDFSRQHHHK